jgi:hypothetical protein
MFVAEGIIFIGERPVSFQEIECTGCFHGGRIWSGMSIFYGNIVKIEILIVIEDWG